MLILCNSSVAADIIQIVWDNMIQNWYIIIHDLYIYYINLNLKWSYSDNYNINAYSWINEQVAVVIRGYLLSVNTTSTIFLTAAVPYACFFGCIHIL